MVGGGGGVANAFVSACASRGAPNDVSDSTVASPEPTKRCCQFLSTTMQCGPEPSTAGSGFISPAFKPRLLRVLGAQPRK